MTRYKIIIEYDGTGYVGWQSQKNGKSVQKEIPLISDRLQNEIPNITDRIIKKILEAKQINK